MAALPKLTVNELPSPSSEETSATASPARGREMKANLLAKLRAPPLIHAWDFWHDRQDRVSTKSTEPSPATATSTDTATSEPNYEDRLLHLSSISDVRAFWSTMNNFDVSALPLRDSVHLFHRNVKPVWEDPRNSRGGSWTFRVPKEKAPQFWTDVCMMAIGEQLQAAVESDRKTFRDDICGVSLSVRFNSCLVQVWNRDAEHKEGVERISRVVIDGVGEELKPREGSYYYKRHSEHAGFSAQGGDGKVAS